jgi:hypothetical protein
MTKEKELIESGIIDTKKLYKFRQDDKLLVKIKKIVKRLKRKENEYQI